MPVSTAIPVPTLWDILPNTQHRLRFLFWNRSASVTFVRATVSKKWLTQSHGYEIAEVSVEKTLYRQFRTHGFGSADPVSRRLPKTGFPQELIDKIAAFSKRPVHRNINASGTEINQRTRRRTKMRTGATDRLHFRGFRVCKLRRRTKK